MSEETPLELAIQYNLPDVVEALCRRGVDLSSVDKQNNCALWAALEKGYEDIAIILVKNGVDTDNWSEGPEGCYQTLLHRAIDENKETIAKFLVQSGCDLDTPRRAGPGGRGGEEAHDQQSPLHLCCQWGLESVVQKLVEHGANINVIVNNKLFCCWQLFSHSRLFADDDTIRHYRLSVEHSLCLWEVFLHCHSLYKQL
ncbi:Ankyrin repeat and FYVE domain-containing protein 1 [Homalodisca vitripennis]|nr:Ankyrin repeat and FYVE domain-containing protein 1 [Homalodisca vitripennis]